MKLLTSILTLSFMAFSALASTPSIVSPAPGSTVNPGVPFDFKYSSIADYGCSSYNFTVWLFTAPPTNFTNFADYASGYYFGRYSLPNYPGNPYPSNQPPKQLVMPNFAKLPGGFGRGMDAADQTIYLAVIEEYSTGQGTLGYKMSLSYNPVQYNVTIGAPGFDPKSM